MVNFELFVGRRYFRSKPSQAIIAVITLLSILGVIIGVTALIVVIGVMAGFESDLKKRIMGIEPHIVIDQNGQPLTSYEEIAAFGRQVRGVTAIWPVVEFHAMLQTESRVSGALIKGVDPLAASRGLHIPSLAMLDQNPPESSAGAQQDLPPVVVGRDLARALGIFIGDTVFVVSPKWTITPGGIIPFMKRFRVAEFFQTGMYEYDGGLIFMRLSDARMLSRTEGASAVELRVGDIFDIPAVVERLKDSFMASYRFRDWRELNKNLFSALQLEKIAMFITLTLIILVATFSIASSLVMLVMEKTKDIAILKAMGATRAVIRRIFIFQGMLIGLIGTSIGVLFGTLLCYLQDTYQWIRLPADVYIISALPIDLQAIDVILVSSAAMMICFLATLYPAHQASRFNPVEALRYG